MARRPLSLDEQKRALRACYQGVVTRNRAHGGVDYLCFDLVLRPSAASAKYNVLFAYAVGDRPLVWVQSPKLVKSVGGRPTPHLNRDGTLCLFDPVRNEWTAADPIADTIVPWTIRWLFHYEHWIGFGEWLGDKEQVVPVSKPNAPSVRREDVA